MRLANASRFYFFAGWLAWWAAAWLLIYVEYSLRATDWLTPYAVEAWLAMVAPLVVFAAADQLVMAQYEQLWAQFSRTAIGTVVLEREAVDRLRDDLRRSLLLRWFAPPRSASLNGQLLTAAAWLPAISAPDDTPGAVRYRELYGGLAFSVLLLGAGLTAFIYRDPLGLYAALGLLGVALAGIGFGLIRLAARRQAILDYFTAWRGQPGDVDA
jgi:hypothetical protein